MSRVGRLSATVALPLALLAAGFPRRAPAAGTVSGPVATVTATVRSVDAEGGVVEVERDGGGRLVLGLDVRETLIFKGIRTLAPGELSAGMRVEVDYRPAADGATPRASWIEVLDPDRARRPGAPGAGEERRG